MRAALALIVTCVLLLAACLDRTPTTSTDGLALGASSGPNDKPLRWENVTRGPIARQETTVGTLAGKIYVIGGFKDDFLPGAANDYVGGWANPLALVEIYDPATDRWSRGPDYPIPIHHAAAVEVESALYVMGGMTSPAAQPVAISFRLRASSSGWERVASMPDALAAHVAGVINGTIYVGTGFKNNGFLGPNAFSFVPVSHMADVWAYNIQADTWKVTGHRIPTPRDHAGGAVVGDAFCVAGGDVDGHGKRTAATECYHPVSGVWNKLPPVPTARGSMGSATWRGELVLVGGAEVPYMPIGNVTAFNVSNSTWYDLPSMLVPRTLAKVIVVDGALYSLHGATQTASSNVVERLRAPDTPTKQMPVPA